MAFFIIIRIFLSFCSFHAAWPHLRALVLDGFQDEAVVSITKANKRAGEEEVCLTLVHCPHDAEGRGATVLKGLPSRQHLPQDDAPAEHVALLRVVGTWRAQTDHSLDPSPRVCIHMDTSLGTLRSLHKSIPQSVRIARISFLISS